MNEKFIKNTVLFICITFLAMALFGQSALAKNKPTANSLLITSVHVDGANIFIHGQNFGSDGLNSGVSLGGDAINVLAWTDTDIETELPAGIGPGDYLLIVTNQQENDTYALTIGAVTQAQIDELIDRIEYLESLHQPPRFTDRLDGTVRDNDSGLIWLKDANCIDLAGTDSLGRANWPTAKSAAAALANGTCGLTDGSAVGAWRLPTKGEWEAFYVPCCDSYSDPALVNTVGNAQWTEGDAFDGVQDRYWTSTDAGGSPVPYAYCADVRVGQTPICAQIGNINYVWPVRNGN